MNVPRRGLYAIADADAVPAERLPGFVEAVVEGGAVAVQYRDKNGPQAECARVLLHICRRYGIPLIVNDDPAVARAVGADGVHLGRDDPGCAVVRRSLGREALIGVSCYGSLERARQAEAEGADYVAFGRLFPSATKPAAAPIPLELLARARASLSILIAGIGGITLDNAALAIRHGADLLAVIRDLSLADDPRERARRYAARFATVSSRNGCAPSLVALTTPGQSGLPPVAEEP